MAKDKSNQDTKEAPDQLAIALSAAVKYTVKGRGGSGRVTYLDRFVTACSNSDGNPVEPQKRAHITGKIAFAICNEERSDEIAAGEATENFTLTPDGETPDDEAFAVKCKKVKSQVNAAIANNNNSTSLSYNPKYKDTYKIAKGESGTIGIERL